MGSVGNQKLPELERFLKEHPHITYAVPSSPDYVSLREVFYLDSKANPLIIVRPQTAEDVAFLVNYAKSQDIKFVVRTGGHSLFGHSMVEGAMTIDLRDLAYVQVEQGQKSAKVGGGILQGELVTALHKEGFVTPTGTVPSVGYVGWAAYGGYGPLSAHFGMGVDQIIGAKIVNSTGAIVTANDDLLRGIKGAGGIFGIIVEVTVKVYPMRNVSTIFNLAYLLRHDIDPAIMILRGILSSLCSLSPPLGERPTISKKFSCLTIHRRCMLTLKCSFLRSSQVL